MSHESNLQFSLNQQLEKIKPWLGPINFFLVAALSFGLGRWTKIKETNEPVKIERANLAAQVMTATGQNQLPLEALELKIGGQLVGSKNGTKYHYPWCSGAERIKEENKIWFQSAEEAKRAGYTPAANCPGL